MFGLVELGWVRHLVALHHGHIAYTRGGNMGGVVSRILETTSDPHTRGGNIIPNGMTEGNTVYPPHAGGCYPRYYRMS